MRRRTALVLAGALALMLLAMAVFGGASDLHLLGDLGVPISAAFLGAGVAWLIRRRQGRRATFLDSLVGGYIGIVLFVYVLGDLFPFPVDSRAAAGHFANLLAALLTHGLNRGPDPGGETRTDMNPDRSVWD